MSKATPQEIELLASIAFGHWRDVVKPLLPDQIAAKWAKTDETFKPIWRSLAEKMANKLIEMRAPNG